MLQEIAIILIGIGVIVYVGWKIYAFCTTPRLPGNPCSGCKGCALQDEPGSSRKPDESPSAATDGLPKRIRPVQKKRPPCSCS